MFRDLYEVAQRCKALAKNEAQQRKKYTKELRKTKSTDIEDAIFSFDDNYFSFRENALHLLESGYQLCLEMNISNQWTKKILLALVESNPKEYCSLLNLEIATKNIYTDLTWKATNTHSINWFQSDFNDSAWNDAEFKDKDNKLSNKDILVIWLSKLDTVGFLNDTTYVSNHTMLDSTVNLDSMAIQLINKDSSLTDSTATQEQLYFFITQKPRIVNVPCNRVYFRKELFVEGLPVAADIKLKIDDSYNIFLNGDYIASFMANDTVAAKEHIHILTDVLFQGRNLLSIEAIDSDSSGGELAAMLRMSFLPGWEEKKQQILYESSDKKIKENMALDKYIIIY